MYINGVDDETGTIDLTEWRRWVPDRATRMAHGYYENPSTWDATDWRWIGYGYHNPWG